VHDTSALAIRPAVSFGEPEIRRCLPGELEKGRSYFLRGAARRSVCELPMAAGA
jgi:hypothetical protein